MPLGECDPHPELAVGREQFRVRHEVELLAIWLPRDLIAGRAVVVEMGCLHWATATVTRTLHPWRSLSPTINDVGEEFRVAHAGVGELRDRCALGDPRLADLAAVDLLNAEL